MAHLVAIAHPDYDKFGIVLAEQVGPKLYRLLDDCIIPGYKAVKKRPDKPLKDW